MAIEGYWDVGDAGSEDNMNQNLIQFGLASAKPAAAAGNLGLEFYETDTGLIVRSNDGR